MANLSPPVHTCVLRVGHKCCNGCQTKVKRKLLRVSGVSAVEYESEQGLLTVSGDVNPTTLLHKLTKWGKKPELVSFLGVNSSYVPPTTPEQNQHKTLEKKEKRKTKCCLLQCFGKRGSKSKVEPLAIPNWQYRGVGAENGSATPFNNVSQPPMVYPPPRYMPGFATPIPYPPPYYGARQPQPYTGGMFRSVPPQSPPYTGGMFRSVPPQSPPYFQQRQTEFPHMANSRLHYQHY